MTFLAAHIRGGLDPVGDVDPKFFVRPNSDRTESPEICGMIALMLLWYQDPTY